MKDRELAFTPAWKLRNMLDIKDISPVELTELYLRRIEEFNQHLNAYLTITGDRALAEAKEAECRLMKGERGSLLGIPISIKDLELTEGVRTTMGSLIFKDTVPDRNSEVVSRVKKAGAISLGKTNTPEFGLSGTTENRLGEACRNPWNIERTSGGSSGGAAAAVVSGLCSIAIGSDGGGSIRIPSSFCGLFGIKPTLGRVPRVGGLGQPSPNLTSQTGPMANNVKDAAMMLQVLAGYDSRDPISIKQPLGDIQTEMSEHMKSLKLCWSPDLGYAAVDPEVKQVAKAGALGFEELGCIVDETSFALDYPMESFLAIFTTNAYVSYGKLYETQEDQLAKYTRDSMARGKSVTGAGYASALQEVQTIKGKLNSLMDEYDLLLTPTMAVPAFPVELFPTHIAGREVFPRWDYLPFTPVFNLSGQPAASIPCGFSSDGMPIGLHIVGKWGQESTVMRAAYAFEQIRPWAQHKPHVS